MRLTNTARHGTGSLGSPRARRERPADRRRIPRHPRRRHPRSGRRGPLVRKLSPGMLPSSRFGGPRTTKTMIHVTWHMTTIAFLTVACALLLSGSVLHGDTARGLAVLAAGACTGFAALTVGMRGATIPSLTVAPPRSRPAHRHSGVGVVGSSLKKMGVAATAYDLRPDPRRAPAKSLRDARLPTPIPTRWEPPLTIRGRRSRIRPARRGAQTPSAVTQATA